ncbi:MAG: SRPBCC domain-containing protein [Melioribacter sp.]|nr:SRPBCC domain-containing protein [Melioribacter sp.]
MVNELVVKKSIELNADKAKVWDALVNPEKIKLYLFGTETISDWKVGGPIVFQGVWEGVTYKDKGTILEFIPGQKLKYDYWSSFSKLEDIPENYQQITFDLMYQNGKTILTLTQENVPDQQAKEHSESNWGMVLNQLKQIVEGN